MWYTKLMIISLIVGIILGAVSVFFILQNVVPVTVTFLAWHLNGSLSLVLLAAMATGVLITLLMLLPSFIKDDMYVSVLKKQKKELEDELAAHKQAAIQNPTPPTHTVL